MPSKYGARVDIWSINIHWSMDGITRWNPRFEPFLIEITGLFPFSPTFSAAECIDLRCMSSYRNLRWNVLNSAVHKTFVWISNISDLSRDGRKEKYWIISRWITTLGQFILVVKSREINDQPKLSWGPENINMIY